MNSSELPKLTERLGELAEVLGGKAPTPKGALVWLDALKECSLADVLSVLSDWPKDHAKSPLPVEVLKACRARLSDRLEQESERNRQAPGFSLNRCAENTRADPAIVYAELAKCRAILATRRGESIEAKATRINREVIAAPEGTYSDLRVKAAREYLKRVGVRFESEADREARLEREAITAE